MIPYSKQSISIIDALRVARQVKFRSLTQGTQIKEFENSVASYVGSKYAVAVSSATAGRVVKDMVSKGHIVLNGRIYLLSSLSNLRGKDDSDSNDSDNDYDDEPNHVTDDDLFD